MKRIVILIYSLVAYLAFLVAILWAIAFVGDLWLPRTVSRGIEARGWGDVLLNVLFPLLFAIQHTIMARPAFKAKWTQVIHPAAERSTFVLIASLILAALMWQWKAMPTVLWSAPAPWSQMLWIVYAIGWAMVFYSSFLIDHFDLFGLRQAWIFLRGRPYHHPPFRERSLYRLVRHPLMLGFLLAFWAAPTMTTGRLYFAIIMTVYILVGTRVEERDLRHLLGRDYESYRSRTPMLLPLRFPSTREKA